MRSDFSAMVEMFERSNIDFKISTDTEERIVRNEKREYKVEATGETGILDWPITEHVESGKTLRVDGGYCGFYTIIKFDVEGKLLSIEAYE